MLDSGFDVIGKSQTFEESKHIKSYSGIVRRKLAYSGMFLAFS